MLLQKESVYQAGQGNKARVKPSARALGVTAGATAGGGEAAGTGGGGGGGTGKLA